LSELPIKHSEQINEVFGALAKAKLNYRTVVRTHENTYTGSKYADLQDLIDATQNALASEGLVIMQFPLENLDQQKAGAFTYLGHSSGQFMSVEFMLPATAKASGGASKFDAQSVGAAVTYAKRQTYQGLAGVVGEIEDDGNSLSDKSGDSRQVERPKTVKAPPVSQKVSSQGGERPKDTPYVRTEHTVVTYTQSVDTPTPQQSAPQTNDPALAVPEQGSVVPKADINPDIKNPMFEPNRVESTSSQTEQAGIPADKLKSSEKPTKAQFDAYTARAVALKIPLEKAGLKPSKGLQTGAKLKKYLLEVAGAKELTDLAIYQWEDFFLHTDQTEPVQLVNLIEGGKAA